MFPVAPFLYFVHICLGGSKFLGSKLICHFTISEVLRFGYNLNSRLILVCLFFCSFHRFLFPGSSLEGDAAKEAGEKGITTATKQQQPQPPDLPGPDAPVQEKLRRLADQESKCLKALTPYRYALLFILFLLILI
jgi:hypothetical protein